MQRLPNRLDDRETGTSDVHRQHMAILRVQQGLESTQPKSSDTTLRLLITFLATQIA